MLPCMNLNTEQNLVRLLVVDGEPSIADAIWMMLYGQDDRVLTTETGNALHPAQRWRAHALVLDVTARDAQARRELGVAAADLSIAASIAGRDPGRQVATLEVGIDGRLDGQSQAERSAAVGVACRRVDPCAPGLVAGRQLVVGEL
jgi:hypothetical protein